MDPDIQALLDGAKQPPPDPEANMSALEKLGRMLNGSSARKTLDAHAGELRDAWDSVGDAASGLAGGITGHLDQRIPFGIGDAIRADREKSAKRSPVAETAGEVVGTLGSPIGLEGKAEQELAGAMGRAAASGGMQAVARSLGDAKPDEDAKTQALKALAAGADGVGAGAVIGGAGYGLGQLAPIARRFAVGGTAKDYGDIVKEQGTREGIDYIAKDLGKIPEAQGLTNRIWPQSKAGYATRAAARADDVVGPELGRTLVQAESEIPAGMIDKSVPMSELAGEKVRLGMASRPGGRQLGQAMEQLDSAPFETPSDIAKIKRAYEAESYAKGTERSSQLYAQGQKAGADATRAHLSDVMDSADPVTAAQFHKANRDFADTKLIEGMSKKGSLYDFATPLAGVGLGGMAGYGTGHDAKSTLEGAAVGALAGRYGADLTANVARLGEQSAPSLAKLGGALAGKVNSLSAQDSAGEARGHLIPEAIQDALKSNKLGPYSDELARAAMSPEPGALGVAYSRLSRDPGFAQYKTMLQQMTGSM